MASSRGPRKSDTDEFGVYSELFLSWCSALNPSLGPLWSHFMIGSILHSNDQQRLCLSRNVFQTSVRDKHVAKDTAKIC